MRQWRDAFLGYSATGGAHNGGVEVVNGLIELARRVARGFRYPRKTSASKCSSSAADSHYDPALKPEDR
ncbi:MAG: hypothetical protein ACOH1Y_10140 [Propionicimonas sp.]